MRSPHVTLLAGLTICVVAVLLAICRVEGDSQQQADSSLILAEENLSSVDVKQVSNQRTLKSQRREHGAREFLDVLSRSGYLLTADDIGDYTARGSVEILGPDGSILRGDRMSISADGEDIFLFGSVLVVAESGFVQGRRGVDSFARIAVDGSSQSFTGEPLYEPGSTFSVPSEVEDALELPLSTQNAEQDAAPQIRPR